MANQTVMDTTKITGREPNLEQAKMGARVLVDKMMVWEQAGSTGSTGSPLPFLKPFMSYIVTQVISTKAYQRS